MDCLPNWPVVFMFTCLLDKSCSAVARPLYTATRRPMHACYLLSNRMLILHHTPWLFPAYNSHLIANHFLIFFYNFIVPLGLSSWEIQVAYPRDTYSACWVFSCFHNPPNSDMDHRILHKGPGVYEQRKRVSAERWLWEKIPCHTTILNLCQWRAGSTLYQLSYIPILILHGIKPWITQRTRHETVRRELL